MEKLTVERTIWIAAPRERVWQAITDVDQINQWWGQDEWEFSALQVGASVKFGSGDDIIFATIAVVEPPREFAIQWPPQEQYHSISMVTRYILDEEDGGTRLTVTESGFEALPDDIRQQRFDQTAKGYGIVIADLKAYVEKEFA